MNEKNSIAACHLGIHSVCVNMEYDEQTKALKMMQTEVTINGHTTQMKMEFLLVRSAKDFPDRFFEF